MNKNTLTKGQIIKFQQGKSRPDFHTALKMHVERYFKMTGKKERDSWQLYLKASILMLSLAVAYVTLVFFATNWWQAGLLSVILGLAMAAVGFCVQHDGGHRAFSKHAWINRLTAMALDLLGGSSYMWDVKHNQLHHTYANIDGHDDDIDVGVFGRLAPEQRRFWFHRAQQIYLWFMYGLLPIKWQLWDDFQTFAKGRIGQHRFKRPRGADFAIFIGGKIVFATLAFAIPLFHHSILQVLLTYFIISWCMGVVLSVVFQLAHVVEEAEFLLPDQAGQMKSSWAEHQVRTTVDFAPRNWLLTWFLGGLNFQVEHHLFPKITHIHYPRLSRIVAKVCKKYKVPHNANTFWGAIASHYRHLHRMGQPV